MQAPASRNAAREPKRQRGRLRVAAITATAIEVFTEKGFDATTMTEIAERSGTAIASLYRFFPSKEALADALLNQYAEHVLLKLAALYERADGISADHLAQELIDFRLSLLTQRKFAIGLMDARGASEKMQTEFRDAMLAELARIFRKAIPALGKAKAEAMAVAVSHVLKGVSAAGLEPPTIRKPVLAEMKRLLRAYLVDSVR